MFPLEFCGEVNREETSHAAVLLSASRSSCVVALANFYCFNNRLYAKGVRLKVLALCTIINCTFTLSVALKATGMKLPGCDLIPRVPNYCLREWQEIWNNCVNNKLYAIYQTVGSVVHNKGLSRHESVIINRLRIGHTRLTHS